MTLFEELKIPGLFCFEVIFSQKILKNALGKIEF